MMKFTLTAPPMNFDERLGRSPNVFADIFGALDDAAWLRTLVASLQTRVIEGVEFPPFPPEELQNRLHGTDGEVALHAAANFYRWVKGQGLAGPEVRWPPQAHMLDFGTGWGRILRQFLRDFPLANIIGFEPNGAFATIARGHNPHVAILSGSNLPPLPLRDGLIHLITGYSVFSHLSLASARAWIGEFARVLAPGGAAVLTTWGLRFLDRLVQADEKMRRGEGEQVHWYTRICVERAGDLAARIAECRRGEFVFLSPYPAASYGEAFLPETVIARIIAEDRLPLAVETYDDKTLEQDVFVLRRL